MEEANPEVRALRQRIEDLEYERDAYKQQLALAVSQGFVPNQGRGRKVFGFTGYLDTMLRALANNEGKIVSHYALALALYGEDNLPEPKFREARAGGKVYLRAYPSMDVQLCRLRARMREKGLSAWVETVKGQGLILHDKAGEVAEEIAVCDGKR